jgi:hypothetical protein
MVRADENARECGKPAGVCRINGAGPGVSNRDDECHKTFFKDLSARLQVVADSTTSLEIESWAGRLSDLRQNHTENYARLVQNSASSWYGPRLIPDRALAHLRSIS